MNKCVARLLSLGLFLLVAACADSVPPPLTPLERASYNVDSVAVHVAKDARIWWGEGEREIARAAGIDDSIGDAAADYVETSPGREALMELLVERTSPELTQRTKGLLSGTKPAHLSILISAVHVASLGQQILVGGAHEMVAAVQLFDSETGEPLTPARPVLGTSKSAMGGLLGAAIDASRSDPIFRVAHGLGKQTARWLTATSSISMPNIHADSRPSGPVPGPELPRQEMSEDPAPEAQESDQAVPAT